MLFPLRLQYGPLHSKDNCYLYSFFLKLELNGNLPSLFLEGEINVFIAVL